MSASKKYVVVPGMVQSRTDRQWHYVSADRLMQLYQVSRVERIIARRESDVMGVDVSDLILLVPDSSGQYEIPTKPYGARSLPRWMWEF